MKRTAFAIFWLFFFLCSVSAFGQSVRVGPNGEFSAQTLSLPYAFYNESFGFAAGYVYGVVGRPQKQATLLATAMVGTKESAMGFLVGRDLQMPRVEGLFLDPVISVGYFKDNEAYIVGNPDFPGERAGSNGSDKDNYVEGDGWDNFFRLKFKYLLPIGAGRNQIIATYKIKDGLLESGSIGGTSLNPFKSGLNYLELRPFYRSQQIDGDDVDEVTKTNQWIQVAPFFEIGRVAPSWNIEELHSDMKWDAGLGLRLWAKGIVARIDAAASDEGARVQMMIGQPFQF